jgi:ATP-dependent helicase/nuclease subunit B
MTVYSIPANENLCTQAVKLLQTLQPNSKDFHAVTILVTTTRRAASIKQAIAAHFGACLLPQIMNVSNVRDLVTQGLFDAAHTPKPKSQMERLLAFVPCVQNLEPNSLHQNALPLAQSLVDFFYTLDQENIPWGAVHTLDVSAFAAHHQHSVNLLRQVASRMESARYGSKAAFLNTVCGQISTNLHAWKGPLICVGEDLNQPAMVALFQAIGASPQGHYIHYAPPAELRGEGGLLTLVEAQSIAEEARLIAAIVRKELTKPDAKVIIACPHAALKPFILNELAAFSIEANVSTGVELIKTPYGTLSLLAAQFMSQPDTTLRDALALLNHPLVQSRAPQERELLREALYAWSYAYYTKRRMDKGEGISLWGQLNSLRQTWPVRAPFHIFLNHHLQLLKQLMGLEEGGDFDGPDGKALAAFWAELAAHTACLNMPVHRTEYAAYFKTLATWAEGVFYPTPTHTAVYVVDPFEVTALKGTCVILTSLNSTHWEKPAVDPYLSYGIAQRLGAKHEERRFKALQNVVQYSLSWPVCFATRPCLENDSPSEASSFWIQLNTGQALERGAEYHSALESYVHLAAPIKMEPSCITATHALPRLTALSISDVENLMRDPYRVAAKVLLGLKPLDFEQNPLSPAEQGTTIHRILQALIQEGFHKQPDVFAFKNKVRRALEKAEKGLYRHAFWWPRISHIIDAVHNHALKLNPADIWCEYTLEAPLEGLTLKGVLDRIDFDGEGTGSIIDYKTGVLPSRSDVQLGFSPQIYLQAYVLEQSGVGINQIALWQLKGKPEEPIKPLAFEWPGEARDVFEKGLCDLVRYMSGEGALFLACPDPSKMPTYNPYAHLERLDEWLFRAPPH